MQDVEFTCESGYAVNVGNVIATGTAGTVYNGRSSDGTPVVVKVVKDGKSASTCRELEVLRACCKGDSRSANLHPYHGGADHEDGSRSIVLGVAGDHDLQKLLGAGLRIFSRVG